MEPSPTPPSNTATSHHDITQCLTDLQARIEQDSSSLDFKYIAEGNANVIYAIATSGNDATTLNDAQHVGCAVLRLRKDLSFTLPSIEVLSAFKKKILPLFAQNTDDSDGGDWSRFLLPQILCTMSPAMASSFSGMLTEMESSSVGNLAARPMARRGAYHPSFEDEPHAILMPNLFASGGRVVEFKPKWLVQSPSAPAKSERCRTCAVNMLRRLEGRHKGRGDSGFCPFALLHDEDEVLDSALDRMDPIKGKVLKPEFVKKVRPALLHLQSLQRRYGSVGLQDFQNPDAEDEEKDFSVAMALRDCSVFLVISNDTILDVKFADLDLKTTEGGKIERWAEIEQSLISKGLYTDLEDDGSHPCYWGSGFS
jgi:inositol-pentakisphosphate 2-kinase